MGDDMGLGDGADDDDDQDEEEDEEEWARMVEAGDERALASQKSTAPTTARQRALLSGSSKTRGTKQKKQTREKGNYTQYVQ